MTTWTVPARIVRIVDGDTLRCDLDLGWGVWLPNEPVRLARINAPELGTVEGTDAAKFLTGLCAPVLNASGVLFTSTGFDKYRRALGELVVPSLGNLSDLMLSSGHAFAYGPRTPPKPPEAATLPRTIQGG